MSKNQFNIAGGNLPIFDKKFDARLEARKAKELASCPDWQDRLFVEIVFECRKDGAEENWYFYLLKLLRRLGCHENEERASEIYLMVEEAFAEELRATIKEAA